MSKFLIENVVRAHFVSHPEKVRTVEYCKIYYKKIYRPPQTLSNLEGIKIFGVAMLQCAEVKDSNHQLLAGRRHMNRRQSRPSMTY